MTPFNTFNCIYLQGGIMHELARKVTLMRVGCVFTLLGLFWRIGAQGR